MVKTAASLILAIALTCALGSLILAAGNVAMEIGDRIAVL